MDQKYFEEIKVREQAATPGPWEICLGSGTNVCTGIHHYNNDGKATFIADCLPDYALDSAEKDHRPNLRFIAYARTDIPALIEQHEQDQQQIAALKKLLYHYAGCYECKVRDTVGCDEAFFRDDCPNWEWRGTQQPQADLTHQNKSVVEQESAK